MSVITAERARELLNYDPKTGLFTWLIGKPGTSKGATAGSRHSEGYVHIRVDGRHYFAHRLAWLIVHGQWPTDQIDHYNGLRDDNRLANLREATRSLNMQNLKGPLANNTSGYLGVSWNSRDKSFVAHIKINGKTKCLGYFKDPAEAHHVYMQSKRLFHAGNTL